MPDTGTDEPSITPNAKSMIAPPVQPHCPTLLSPPFLDHLHTLRCVDSSDAAFQAALDGAAAPSQCLITACLSVVVRVASGPYYVTMSVHHAELTRPLLWPQSRARKYIASDAPTSSLGDATLLLLPQARQRWSRRLGSCWMQHGYPQRAFIVCGRQRTTNHCGATIRRSSVSCPTLISGEASVSGKAASFPPPQLCICVAVVHRRFCASSVAHHRWPCMLRDLHWPGQQC